MKVFIVYDLAGPARQAELIRLFERSWGARGWRVLLLTKWQARKHPDFVETMPVEEWKWLALYIRTRGRGGLVMSSSMMNFSARNGKEAERIAQFSYEGWETSPVVNFPNNFGMDEILTCGRSLE